RLHGRVHRSEFDPLAQVFLLQARESRISIGLRPGSGECGKDRFVLFLRKTAWGQSADDVFFLVTVMPQKRGKVTRAAEERHSSSRYQRLFNLDHERTLIAVF